MSVDEPEYSSDDEQSPSSEAAAPTATPSKKAAARARAKLRKKTSSQTLADQAQAAISSLPTAAEAKAALASQGGAAVSQAKAAAASLPTAAQAKAAAGPAATKANNAVAHPVGQAKSAAGQVKAAATSVASALPAAAGAKVVKAAAAAATAVSSAAKEAMPAEVPSINFPDGPSAYDDGASSSDEGEPPAAYDSSDESDIDETSTTKAPLAKAPSPLASPKPKQEAYTGADHDPGKKKAAILTRTLWGLAMGGGAITICALGHIYVIALVFVIQAVVFGELTSLFDAGYAQQGASGADGTAPVSRKRANRREERDRWSKRMAWYFFAATNYFLYGESLIYYFKHILTLRASFLPTAYSFAQHHRLISFGLYIIGFVSFVANLKRASLRRQFGLFGWIHMSLLLIVVSAHFIVNNILEGMIWFWIPASLVIFNDVAAYVCGMLFGRHQLIKLSPKKTVEGFVGAIVVTIWLGVGWSTLFMKSNYMICPAQNLAASAFSDIQCTPNSAFVYRSFQLPESVVTILENIVSCCACPMLPLACQVLMVPPFP